jgi:hypothetical protein
MRDHSHDPASFLSRIACLEKELAKCKAESALLSQKVAFLTSHPTIAAGIKGVTLIAELLRQPPTTGNAPYDIGGKVRIEVKYACLCPNVPGSKTLRWEWGKVFGNGGKKEYDRLILVGEKDPRFLPLYKGLGAPYAIFDVPYEGVQRMVTDGGEARERIMLLSNPQKVRPTTRARPLYAEYEVTVELLESTYAWQSADWRGGH